MINAIIGNMNDAYAKLKPFYEVEAARGNLNVVGYVDIKNSGGGGDLSLFKDFELKEPLKNLSADIIIISSERRFMHYVDFYKNFNIPQQKIIDGRVFQVEGFDFPRFMREGIAYGSKNSFEVKDATVTIYPRIHQRGESQIILNSKSYIAGAEIVGIGKVNVGKFTAISWDIKFQFGLNCTHHHNYATTFSVMHIDWDSPLCAYHPEPIPLNIGNDVWIGLGTSIKVEKPLTIGNGSIIAADSVVVKDVPPYAIVGGNPAKFIKWRFDEKIREGLNKIAWWDWSLDKIRANYNLMADPEKFVEKFLPKL